jgi:hypothetical protein
MRRRSPSTMGRGVPAVAPNATLSRVEEVAHEPAHRVHRWRRCCRILAASDQPFAATFSIVAVDLATGDVGVVVESKFPNVRPIAWYEPVIRHPRRCYSAAWSRSM